MLLSATTYATALGLDLAPASRRLFVSSFLRPMPGPGLPTTLIRTDLMNFFKRIAAALGSGETQDDMANSYSSAALETTSDFGAYPPKVFLKEKGVFAYRLEFATFESDAIRVVQALSSEFSLTDPATLQEGQSRHNDK